MATDREMIDDIVRLGMRAVVLLRGVAVKKVDREILEWGLGELRAGELLEKYFARLVEEPAHAPLLNILHIVYSLEGQLDYQIREYGLDSVSDDLQELNASLNQVAERHEVTVGGPSHGGGSPLVTLGRNPSTERSAREEEG
jgi:hypothetical protein